MHGLSFDIFTFDLGPIPNVKVKVMHIFTMNVLEMMRDREKIAIAIKYSVHVWIQIGTYTFDRDLF